MIFAPQRKPRPSRAGTYLLIAGVSSLMTVAIMDKTPVRASVAKETPCNAQEIIRGHYQDVINDMGIDYNPAWVGPTHKPRRD